MLFEALRQAYKGKKVFLTGHTGFKGTWLLKILTLLGADVKGYALAPLSSNDIYNLIDGDNTCDSVIDDLRNKERLIAEIVDFEPDFIFHLAAQPLVRLSYEIPSATFEINAIGTATVLDGMRNLTKSCFAIMITTDKVYHNNEWIYPYRETDRLGGFDPYSASKACTELVIDSYRNSFFNLKDYDTHNKAIAVARAGNVIGGGDWSKDRLVPDIVKYLSNNEKIAIRNPNSVRPWQHVIEPVLGYLLLGINLQSQPLLFSSAFNFGPYPDSTMTVENMVKYSIDCWGSGEYEILKQNNQPHEAGLLKLDISKSLSMLSWEPKLTAVDSLTLTIDWYKEFHQSFTNINLYTENQITNYLNRYDE